MKDNAGSMIMFSMDHRPSCCGDIILMTNKDFCVKLIFLWLKTRNLFM